MKIELVCTTNEDDAISDKTLLFCWVAVGNCCPTLGDFSKNFSTKKVHYDAQFTIYSNIDGKRQNPASLDLHHKGVFLDLLLSQECLILPRYLLQVGEKTEIHIKEEKGSTTPTSVKVKDEKPIRKRRATKETEISPKPPNFESPAKEKEKEDTKKQKGSFPHQFSFHYHKL